MPFIAKDNTTNKRIDITKLANPRGDLNASEIVCQLCSAPMIVKAGLIMRPHFAHKVKCTSDFESHPESHEHRLGKQFLAEKLPRIYGGTFDVAPLIEYPLKEVRRVADVMIVFPNGWRVAHEVQLASITTETLEQRTQDYQAAGVDLFWWLGGSADTPANRAWAQDRFGCVGRIQFDGEDDRDVRILAEGGIKIGLMPGKLKIKLCEANWSHSARTLYERWSVYGTCSTDDVVMTGHVDQFSGRLFKIEPLEQAAKERNLKKWRGRRS